MLYFNCICLFFFLFIVCYLQKVECDAPLLSYEKNLNDSINVTDIGNVFQSGQRDLVKKPTMTTKRKFGITTHQPVPRTSVYSKPYVTRHSKKHFVTSSVNGTTIVMARDNEIGQYDKIPGTVYLCNSDKDCYKLLENSTCLRKLENFVGSSHCDCIPEYFHDGEKCIKKDNVYYCSSHWNCGIIENSRCTYVISREQKFCKCPKNYIFDEYRCLQKVRYKDSCISSKQCVPGTECLDNICRIRCRNGYSWKYDQCMKDLPTSPPYYEKSLLSGPGLVGFIVGIFLLVVLIASTLVILLHRRLINETGHVPLSNSSNSLRTENSAPFVLPSHSTDQPPSYNDVIRNSTETLTTNAEDMSEDLPPTYESWEYSQFRASDFPCH